MTNFSYRLKSCHFQLNLSFNLTIFIHIGVCKLILENIDEKVEAEIPQDDHGKTPLHYAAESGHSDVYKLYLEYLKEKKYDNNKDYKTRNLETTIRRIKNPQNPEDFYGMTPLHYAATNGQKDLCRVILENVQEKNPGDSEGITPLHNAARNGHSEVCQLILENVQEKNPKDGNGLTPLYFANENGHWNVQIAFSNFNVILNDF